MRRGAWLIATALALCAAAPAQAAPIVLGTGTAPSVTLDPAGTAHIVFNSPGGQTYCRLPRNAKACDVLTPLPLEGGYRAVKIMRRASDGVLLIVQGSTADLDDATHGTTWLRFSSDNGATWQGPFAIGGGVTHAEGIALSNDGQSVLTVTDDTGPIWFQLDPFTAPERRTIDLNLNPDGTDHGVTGGADVAQLPSGRFLAVIDTDADTRWRTFSGGDPFSQAAWAPFPGKRVAKESDPQLSVGKRGTYLLNWRPIPAQRGPSAPFVLRSYDARRDRWRAAKPAAEDRLVNGAADLEQDASGRLHLAWATNYIRTSCVVYARTGTRSSSWFGRSTTLFRTTAYEHAPVAPAIAAGPDGSGVAVWGEAGAQGGPGYGQVYATPLKQRKGRYRPIRDSYDRNYC